MLYTDFKDAAKIHLNTCLHLKDCLSQNNPPKNKEALIHNAYYLGGYVIECSVKRAIYHRLGADRNTDIKHLTIKYNNHDYTYDFFKTHNYKRLIDLLNQIVSTQNTPYIKDKSSISKQVRNLLDKWDSTVRYGFKEIGNEISKSLSQNQRYDILQKGDVIEFIDVCQKIHNELTKL